MNTKTNLQDLATLMAAKSGIATKDVEDFLKELIETVQETLLKDETVRIKNLGTFKRITVSARESVDVSTGKRVQIPAHSKINFVPDNDLAEAVNEPFNIFPPIELEDPANPNETEPERKEPTIIVEERPVIVEERPVILREETPTINPTPGTPPYSPPHKPPRPKKRRNTRWIGSLIFILFLVAGVGFLAYLFLLDKTNLPINKSATKSVSIPVHTKPIDIEENIAEDDILLEDDVIQNTVEDDAVIEDEDIIIEESSVEETTLVIPVEKTDTDEPGSSDKQYTLQRGDFLTSIAQKEYGNKIFWVYLYEKNKEKIKDPNNVSAGLTIAIPEASEYDINKDDPESVQKATELQRQIYKSFPQQNSRSSQQQYRQQQNRSSQQQSEGSYEQQYNDFPFY